MSLPSRLPESVATQRLRLDLVGPDEAADLVAGRRLPSYHPDYPRPDDRDAMTLVRGADPWGPRHIVRLFDEVVFGSIGFFGQPEVAADETPEVEIGYGLVPDARGRGVATEAVQAMTRLADGAGTRVRASVAPENVASIRVLAKCGFTQLRGTTEDGELVMVRPLPANEDSAP